MNVNGRLPFKVCHFALVAAVPVRLPLEGVAMEPKRSAGCNVSFGVNCRERRLLKLVRQVRRAP